MRSVLARERAAALPATFLETAGTRFAGFATDYGPSTPDSLPELSEPQEPNEPPCRTLPGSRCALPILD